MEDERTRFSYTPRSINIAATSGVIAVSLLFIYFAFVPILFPVHHGREPFSNITVIIVLFCCCASYFLAAGLAFYSKRIWQNYIPAWLIVSFCGSILFSFLSGILFYINTLDAIKKYKESVSETSWYSGVTPRPELPNLEQAIFEFLILTLILFVITGLVSSISSYYAPLFTKKKEEPYTLLEL